jgi:hypothetical protein
MGDLERSHGALNGMSDPPLGRVLVILAVAGVAGWLSFRVAGRLLGSAPVAWWVGMLIALGLAILLASRVMANSGVAGQASLLAAGGWAIAASAGWSFSVAVGGTFAGLVTAIALDRRQSRASLPFIAAILLVALLVLCGSWWLVRERGVPVTLAIGVPLTCLALSASGMIRAALPRRWIPWVAGGGLVWVAAWAAAVRMVGTSPSGYGVALAELIPAFGGMGLLAVLLLPLRGRAAGISLIAWLGAGGLAAVAGMMIDTGLQQFYLLVRGQSSQPGAFLDIGHAIGMAVGGAFAVLVAYRTAWSSESMIAARPASRAIRS